MEKARKMLSGILSAGSINNNTIINCVLGGSFLALSIRSMNQQNDIKALEIEKDALLKTNKAMKKTMWDWKQQLFAEATDEASSPVSLSRLKAIYGEAPPPPATHQGVAETTKEESKSPVPKFIV